MCKGEIKNSCKKQDKNKNTPNKKLPPSLG